MIDEETVITILNPFLISLVQVTNITKIKNNKEEICGKDIITRIMRSI